MEANLTLENQTLRSDCEAVTSELQQLREQHQEQQSLLQECQEKIASLVQDYQKQINDLQLAVDELSVAKVSSHQTLICLFVSSIGISNKSFAPLQAQLEKDNAGLKSRVQNLQLELDNTETVQRDFVKLSQSLQVGYSGSL